MNGVKKNVNLTPKEAADIINCSVSTVYRYIAEGHLSAFKRPGRNGSWLIPDSSVHAFLAECRRAGE
ncbi:MAG: helix-turn-helix domain-containing protein [Deferribacterales bacterium]